MHKHHTQHKTFCFSHLRELDHKEGWTPKKMDEHPTKAPNWCFRIVVRQKTLESPLDYKEIKPVQNQRWTLIGRTDAAAEAPKLWTCDAKSFLTLRLWCWERLRAKKRRRQQRRRWLDSITVDGHEFEQSAGDCEEQKDQCAEANGLTVKCDLAPEHHLREKSWQSGKQATLMLTDFNSCISLHKITWIFKDYGGSG